ncbi:MAG: LysR family transcriptional regulator [Pseudomonadota bacterium]
MDRFSEIETFVSVAEAGGFNAAARALGRSAPSVTRIVAGLEGRIGTRLFNRTTRQVALTEVGRRLLEDARRILDDLATAEASAAGAHQDPQGLLTVTAPVMFGRLHIAPILHRFMDQHPAVTARMIFVDRVVNLIDEGIDIAVRIGDLPDSSLTALRVGDVRRCVVASPEYLARSGRPDHPQALEAHRIAIAASLSPPRSWDFLSEDATITVPIRPALSSNSVDASIDAALSGWALTRALSYQVADHLKRGNLVEVLPEFETRRLPVHLVHAEGRLRAAKIRAFLDMASTELRRKAHGWIAPG